MRAKFVNENLNEEKIKDIFSPFYHATGRQYDSIYNTRIMEEMVKFVINDIKEKTPTIDRNVKIQYNVIDKVVSGNTNLIEIPIGKYIGPIYYENIYIFYKYADQINIGLQIASDNPILDALYKKEKRFHPNEVTKMCDYLRNLIVKYKIPKEQKIKYEIDKF
jgi:hypothetical protein